MPWPTVNDFKAYARIADDVDDAAIRTALSAAQGAILARCPLVDDLDFPPPEVEQAALLWASRLLARRNSPDGIVGNPEFGVVNIGRADPDVARLLAPYVAIPLA